VPAVSPHEILLSRREDGETLDPTALLFEPLATINAEAKEPVPDVPFTVPASIVKVAPLLHTWFIW
jgi:hypothetical protein